MTEPLQGTVLIVGLGLIGGSIARGLRTRRPDLRLLAHEQDDASLATAVAGGTVEAAEDLGEAVAKADLVVLAVPPRRVAELLGELAPLLGADTVITDVASVKSWIGTAAGKQSPAFRENFVPGHPIAGSEKSGFAAAGGDLFEGRQVILTPLPETGSRALAVVNGLWRALGAEVLGMSIARHDEVLAATSHLPHLLAYGVVDTLVSEAENEDIFRYAAGGFADFSRLASSNPRMWTDIFLCNGSATTHVLDAYIDRLQRLRGMLVDQDEEAMMQTFSEAKRSRDRFIARYFSDGKQATQEKEVTALDYIVEPGGEISGDIRVPGDKSVSHRSVIFGALAEGVTRVSGFLEGEDALNTVAAFREMGVTIVGPEAGEMQIHGVGMKGLQAPRKALYMGNSGTAMRLLAGLLAAQDFASELSGDESLSKRPMQRVIGPLQEMGAQLESAAEGRPPLQIRGGGLKGIDYAMPMASAQVKSCLLLAGLYAEGETRVVEPAPTRDHTERMLRGFGYEVHQVQASGEVSLRGGGRLKACAIDVPADISSAAFFLVAASICPGAELILRHVGVNPTRTGIINLLRAMGADISLDNERTVGGEPVADLTVRQAPLKGIEIPADQIPLAIDEFPVLFVAAACAEGETLLRGAEELRVKESDRLEAMAQGLTTLGIEVESFPDGLRIRGGQLGAGEVDSQGDHRIAMAFAVAGLRASGTIRIRDCANVATSFPGFLQLARSVGMRLDSEAG